MLLTCNSLDRIAVSKFEVNTRRRHAPAGSHAASQDARSDRRRLGVSGAPQGGHGVRVCPQEDGDDAAARQRQYFRVEMTADSQNSGRDPAPVRVDEFLHSSLHTIRLSPQMPKQHLPGHQYNTKKRTLSYWRASASVFSPPRAPESW